CGAPSETGSGPTIPMSTLASGLLATDYRQIRDARREFVSDVRAGLSKPLQKELHSKYLYDDLGSALFDAITFLPEYGLTRADIRLLKAHATEIAETLPGRIRVAELGSGNGSKTRPVLQAVARRQRQTAYHPIDVSPAALARCSREVADLAAVHPTMS